MKIYLVGGAVRDRLIQHYHPKFQTNQASDQDWVVTGATAQQMQDLGFKAVGKDFPVFLHPDSKQEYALARTERKTAPGYKGFCFHADPSVTLEQDLKRRDLTINAIAQDEQGHLIDPYSGEQDIKNKVLRHVSTAFCEDPVRILRIARFAARFAHFGFTIADETLTLMQQMVAQGEVEHLVADRVWQELSKALQTPKPSVFFQVLHDCGALAVVLPKLAPLFANTKHYRNTKTSWCNTTDGCDLYHYFATALNQTGDSEVRLASALKILAYLKPELPLDLDIEQTSVNLLPGLPLPKKQATLIDLVYRYHPLYDQLQQKPSAIENKQRFGQQLLTLIAALGTFKGKIPSKLALDFVAACSAPGAGLKPKQTRFIALIQQLQAITPQQFMQQGLSGSELGEALYLERLKKVCEFIA